MLRFELVKRPAQARGQDFWAAVFEGDPHGHLRTARETQKFTWKQTESDVTVAARVPVGTSKFEMLLNLETRKTKNVRV